MRIRLIFQLKNRGATVPFHHQHLISSVIDDMKSEVGITDSTAFEYCFSGIKGQTKVGKGGLFFFSNKVTIVISSPQAPELVQVLQAIFKKPSIHVGELELIPDSMEEEILPKFEESVKYVCISPLVAVSHFSGEGEQAVKQFIEPTTDVFSDFLYESIILRMESSGRFTSAQLESYFKFQVVPDKVYLEKTKANGKKFSRIYFAEYQSESKEIRGYTLPLTVYAHPDVQQFIYECGFGEYTEKGYGLLDIANANPLERVKPFTF